MIVIGVTGGALVLFIALYCFAKDSEKIKFTADMIRTIIGFCYDLATGMLGIPAK